MIQKGGTRATGAHERSTYERGTTLQLNKRTTDFTTGSIPRHLVAFSLPMFLGNLLQALYNTVDSIWVGRFLGPAALGAVSVSFPIIFAIVSLIMGITMATTVLVSQYAGARQMDMVRKVSINSLALMVVSAIVASAFGIAFHRPLLVLINTPAEIIDEASSYLNIYLAGLIFMFIYNVLGAILRGLGDSRTPLLFLVYATVINIVLDPLLIFGLGPFPKMGVAGAALATDIAQGISAFLALAYLKGTVRIPLNLGGMKLDRSLAGLTLKIGLPAGAQQTVVSFGGLALSSIVNSFGKVVVAAFGAASRFDQFAFLPAMSVNLAVSALVGQNLGAGKDHRVKEIVRWSIFLVGGITALVAIVAVGAPRLLLGLFTRDVAVVQEGMWYLRIVGLSYVLFAVMFVFNGVLRGAGDTVPTMFITMVSLWLVRIPLAEILSSFPAIGSRGVPIAIALSPLVGLSLSWGYYRTGRWKRKVVVRRPVPSELMIEDVPIIEDRTAIEIKDGP